MDTMTYASVAALPWSAAQINKHPIVPEAEFPSYKGVLNMAEIDRKLIFQGVTPAYEQRHRPTLD